MAVLVDAPRTAAHARRRDRGERRALIQPPGARILSADTICRDPDLTCFLSHCGTSVSRLKLNSLRIIPTLRFGGFGGTVESNIPSPGAPPKLDDMHKAFLRRIVDEGPIPAVHAWCAGGQRSDHAGCRGVRALGVGKDLGLLACECPAEGLQAGRKTPWRRSEISIRRVRRDRSASTYPASAQPRPDGDARVPVLINFSASSAV